MALFYLHEKGNEKSKHKRYFESLKQDYSEFITMWDAEALDIIKGAELTPAIVGIQKAIEADYNTIINDIPEANRGQFTFEEYR